MPIEVKCPGCQALLRIAEENLGRKSRCPSCSEVFVTEVPHSEVSPFVAPVSEAEPQDGPWQGVASQANPYAPTYVEPESQADSGPLTPRLISVDEVLSKSWLIFKKHWAMLCVVMLILTGINIALNIGQNVLIAALNAAVNEPLITVGVQFLIAVVMYVFQVWLQLGQTMVMLDVARGRPINISKLFAGAPFLLNGVIAWILVSLSIGVMAAVLIGLPTAVGLAVAQAPEGAVIGAVGGVLVAIVPILFVSLAISQYLPLIVDRRHNAIDSLRQSYNITNGNKFTLFLIGVVMMGIAIAAMIVGFLLLCVGVIPAFIGVGAFSMLLFAVAYLSMTGQTVVVPGSANDPSSSQFTSALP